MCDTIFFRISKALSIFIELMITRIHRFVSKIPASELDKKVMCDTIFLRVSKAMITRIHHNNRFVSKNLASELDKKVMCDTIFFAFIQLIKNK